MSSILAPRVAVDAEMMGLNLTRDRLCLVQLRGRDTDIHLVQIAADQKAAPNLKKILQDRTVVKIFHFARQDVASLKHWLNIDVKNIYCTKIASKLTRTYAERHGLKDVVREYIGVEINKQQTTTNWGADKLTQEQIDYAAADVLHLHHIKDKLQSLLEQEGRDKYAQACFDFLPTRAALDLLGWEEIDIFAHQ
jgi:ribonuclease D